MRGVKSNNETYKIISDEDILITNSSNINKSLKDIVDEQNQEIQELRNNVRWLYKYGGVGGGGGSSSTKLKASLSITYTDTGGNSQTQSLSWNASSPYSFVIKEATKVTISATVTLGITNTEKFIVRDANSSALCNESFPDSRIASYTFTPGENQQYTAQLNHSSTWTTAIKLYTKVNAQTLTINKSTSGNAVVDANDYTLKYTLINYFPSYFTSQSIKSVTVNNQNVSFNQESDVTTSSDSEAGTHTTTLSFSLKDTLNSHGIYNVVVQSTFGNASLECSGNWIRKGTGVYIYAYLSSGRPLYSEQQQSPTYYSDRSDTLNFRLYPHTDDNISQSYTVTLSIGGTSQQFYEVNNQKSDKSYTIYNSSTTDAEVSITFEWSRNGTSSTQMYYLYWGKPQELAYFFKEDKNEYNYYGAQYETITGSVYSGSLLTKNPLTTDSSGNLIGANTEVRIGSVPKKVLTDTQTGGDSTTSVATCVKWETKGSTLQISEGQSPTQDFMLSLGINFYDYSTTNTILTIGDFTLTKNALTYNNESISFCIPKDDSYHLVQLYFKQRYSVTYSENDSIPDSAVCVFIDGIIESKFITGSAIVPAKDTIIKVNSGRWAFNHFGVAFFNFYDSDSKNFQNYSEVYKKYLYDIDPIIPVNYWQTWKNSMNQDTSENKKSYFIEASIYNTFSTYNSRSTWLNYLQTSAGASAIQKFIPVSEIKDIQALTNLPIYIITPTASELDTKAIGDKYEYGQKYCLNDFLYNTLSSFNEEAYKWEVPCNLQVYENGTPKNVLPSKFPMYIRYQGSSTLLYSTKNFEIGTKPYEFDTNLKYTIYWTPDKNKFGYCEKCFNLKADVVDSSHSNNVIIGNFVNDVMTSPFNKGNTTYRPCLTGFPVLLLAQNSYKQGTNVTTDSNYLFLGIYSFNLARSSVHNLGYSGYGANEQETKCVKEDSTCSNSSYFVQHSENDQVTKQFAIGEVSGNLGIYDFTQFDLATINQSLLGDFFISEANGKINESIDNKNTTFQGLFQKLAAFVNEYLLSNESGPIFNSLSVLAGSEENRSGYYFKGITLTSFSNASLYTAARDVEAATFCNYRKQKGDITCMLSPSYQFHRVVDKDGNATTANLYYLDKNADVPKFSDLSSTEINLEAFVQYYVICMAFGMVDSVQKNLTFKGVKNDSNNYVWYLGFYDMDTAFGIANDGSEASFQAFSDWVTKDGKIIQDYAGNDVTNFKGYDTPSSAAFLYAKYYHILTSSDEGESDGSISIPIQLWNKLRSVNSDSYKTYTGLLESAEKFKKRYISNYFGEINPLIWNLNFLYKYFSTTHVSDITQTDSELKRFHGTRTYSRIEYLDKRLSYLDVMFGFKNNRNIGKSTQFTIGKDYSDKIPSNDDIAISGTAFTAFTKGISNITSASTQITAEARTPFILQTQSNTYTVVVTDETGRGTVPWSVGSNADIGFWGSQQAKEISNIGYFLSNADQKNTIKSKYLEKIELAATPQGITDLEISINCNDCPSVSTITVDNNTGNIKTLSITGGTNLKTLTITSLNCKTLTLSNISKDCTTTINTLTVTDTLTVTSGTYVDLTLTSPSLNKVIYKGSGEKIEIKGVSGIKELTVGEQNASCTTLKALKVENCVQLSTLYVNASGCSTIQLNTEAAVDNDSVNNTTLTSATLQVANNCDVQIPHFTTLSTITWSTRQSIVAKNYAFAQNKSLGQEFYPDTIDIAGKNCFSETSITSIKKNWSLNADCLDFSQCFYKCSKLSITNKNLKSFLQNKVVSKSLYQMFKDCPNVGEYLELDTQNVDCFLAISDIWEEVTKAGSYQGIFFNTNINYWKDSYTPKTWHTFIGTKESNGPVYLDVDSLQQCQTFNTDNLCHYLYSAVVFVDSSLRVVSKVSKIFPKVTDLTLGHVCKGFIFDGFPQSLTQLSLYTRATTNQKKSLNYSKTIQIQDSLFDKQAFPCKFTIYDYGYQQPEATYTLASGTEGASPSYYKLMYNAKDQRMKAYFSSEITYSGAVTLFYVANNGEDTQTISVTAPEAANMIKACCGESCNYQLRYLFANVEITEDLISLQGTITGPTSRSEYLSMSGMFYCPSSSHTSQLNSAISFEGLFSAPGSGNKYRVYDTNFMFQNQRVKRIKDTPPIKMVKSGNSVPTMQKMFCDAKWDNDLLEESLFTKESISQELSYGFTSTNTPALPSKFFGDILQEQSCNCYYMFANSETAYSNDSLQGYIPSDLFTYGDNKVAKLSSASSLFENCKIEFAKGTPKQENSGDSNNSYYYLFPKQYVQVMLGQSQAFHTLYPGAASSSNNSYFTIFEELTADNSDGCAPLYKFPSLRFTRSQGDNHIFQYMGQSISQKVTIVNYIESYNFPNVSCTNKDDSMQYTMETSLACCIQLENPSTSVSSVTQLEQYKPIINVNDNTMAMAQGLGETGKASFKSFLQSYSVFKNGEEKWSNINRL